MTISVYEIITNRIIEELEKGIVPWQKPWSGGSGTSKNLISKKPYQGINQIMTGLQAFDSEYWLTFNQCKKLGGSIKKGSKSTIVIFWKFLEKDNLSTGKKDKIPMLRYYRVFNATQTEDIDYPKQATESKQNNPIESCQKIINELPLGMPKILHEEQRAFYRPSSDHINLPKMNSFNGSNEYYSTYFHELVHSTGHAKRLNREGVTGSINFGSQCYSKEELVAEIGASFLNGQAGILNHVIDNSTAYINSWLNKLRNDKKLIITASGQAQKAVNYLLNIQYKEEK